MSLSCYNEIKSETRTEICFKKIFSFFELFHVDLSTGLCGFAFH